ncbi:MAG: hypothetical protein J7604_17640 [Sporocytophaga sp.]|uniref:hypothetical protein n=1 Tax=Sporocytophaga sp. TaxID=2231183 RepID=UPI001AFE997C|nr:hypothetical protein [Sporocytophaga sp.]MBO9702035.1 hypothetical protein [Sporocytophaga sp.]
MKSKILLIIFFQLIIASIAYSQSNKLLIATTVAGNSINICGDKKTVSIKIKNTTAQAVSNLAIKLVMPTGINYRGSLTAATFVSASPLNEPQFSLASLAAKDSIIITFQANADCQIMNLVRTINPKKKGQIAVTNKTRIDYGINDYDAETSNSYNVIYPALELLVDPLSYSMIGDLGDVVTRKISIRNGGNGDVDTVNFKATYPLGLAFEELRINGSVISYDPNSPQNIRNFLITNFSGANSALGNGSVGDGDAILEYGEVVVLSEKVRFTTCSGSTDTEYEVRWGCYNVVGNVDDNDGENHASTSIPYGQPNISVALLNSPKTDFCNSSPVDAFFSYTNNGIGSDIPAADRANDLRVYLGYQKNVSQISNFRIMKNGSYVAIPAGLISADQDGYFYVTFKNNAAVYNTDIDGPGGLDDLDNDHYYDDLARGETIKIGVGIKLLCPANFATCPLNYDYYYFTTNLQYSDRCLSYENKASNVVSFRNYNLSGTQSITGPTDMVAGYTGTYTFSIDRNYYDNGLLNCTSNATDFVSEIDLPAAYTVSSVKWNNTDLQSGTHYSVTGRKLTINYGGWKGSYSITFSLNCVSGTTYALNDSFNWNMYYKCQACTCRQAIACGIYNVFNHCSESGCAGFSTLNLSLKRTSLGYVESPSNTYKTVGNWKSLGKVNPNVEGLRLDRALEYDTILAVAKGSLVSKTYDKCFVEFSYTVPLGGASDLFEILSSYVKINNVTCTSPIPPPTISQVGGKFTYLFQIPSACKSSFVNLDLVDLYVYLRVKPNLLSSNVDNAITDFRVKHYGKTGTNAMENCNSFGAALSLWRISPSNVTWVGETITCEQVPINAALLVNTSFPSTNGIPDLFPNEFRPLFLIDSVWINMPGGYQIYSNDDAAYSRVRTYEMAVKNIPGFTPGAPDGMVGNTVYWKAKPFWPMGEYIVPGTSHYWLRFRLKPLCTFKDENFYSNFRYQSYVYTGNPSIITRSTKSVSQSYAGITKAKLSISDPTTQEGYSRTVKWNVTLCDKSTDGATGDANYSWIAAEPKVPGINFTYAKDLSSGLIYTANGYGGANSNKVLFKVGTVSKDQCRNFELGATYSGCIDDVVDTIDLKASSGCFAFPDDPAQRDCGNPLITSQLFLRYKTAELQVEHTQLGAAVNPICSNITYEFEFTSTKYADMSYLKLWMELPKGVSLADNNGKIEYPIGTSPKTISSKLENGLKEYDITAFISSNIPDVGCNPAGALPGNRPPYCTDNKLKLKLDIVTDCRVDAGFPEPIRFYAQGTTNCGDVIEPAPFEYRLKIQGFDPLDRMFVDINATSFNANNFSDVSVLYKNTGTVALGTDLPAVFRYLKVVLPPGIALDHMITGNTRDFQWPLEDGSTAYYWLISALAPNASNTISFTIKNVGFASSCEVTRVPINASTVMLTNLSCQGQSQCSNIEATTASDVYILPIPVNILNCDCITSFAPFENDKYTLSAWVKQEKGESLTKYEDGGIIILFEGSNVTLGPIYPSGDIIDGWQKIEYDFTIPANSTNIEIQLANKSRTTKAYFDDIRIHPFNSNMKSYVYDPVSLRLWAELDENNYATFYEYDEEGALIRVKKETERGIKTIQESRNNTVKRP